MVQVLQGPASFPQNTLALSVISYNVLLPNSVDGWWNYKMYNPPLPPDQAFASTWEHRKSLLKERIQAVDADIVCLQEVSPVSFEEDFSFMTDLGYTGKEMFRKGRFRPATFWKTCSCELASLAVHKDRTFLTAFRKSSIPDSPIWYILNVHLQAGREAKRRVRQINEGMRAVLTLSRKLGDKNPESNAPVIVCGDFNGGEECGAVHYLSNGYVDETFVEDGEPVTSNKKTLPLSTPMQDAMVVGGRNAAPTMVVQELVEHLASGAAFDNPDLSELATNSLKRIFCRYATHCLDDTKDKAMGKSDVERWLTDINGKVGRGSEFRAAAREMGWIDDSNADDDERKPIVLPEEGYITEDGFLRVYLEELQSGKFWGVAHDLAVMGEAVPITGVFEARYDRVYCSDVLQPETIVEFTCNEACPNALEPSDHLPVAASFSIKTS